tara:strand:+ start:824 stop:4405 length:3582 start_codon:yes stop_codon:yes gene_type:complete
MSLVYTKQMLDDLVRQYDVQNDIKLSASEKLPNLFAETISKPALSIDMPPSSNGPELIPKNQPSQMNADLENLMSTALKNRAENNQNSINLENEAANRVANNISLRDIKAPSDINLPSIPNNNGFDLQDVSSPPTSLQNDPLKLLQKVALNRESSGNYQAINSGGYAGGYQMGAMALETLGYLKEGSSLKGNLSMQNPANWTGKNNINNFKDYLSNTNLQDQIFLENYNYNVNAMTKNGLINADSPQEDIRGYGLAAHLLGANGAKNLQSEDANGVKGQEYFDLGQSISSVPKGWQTFTSQKTPMSLIPGVTSPLPKQNVNNKESYSKADLDDLLAQYEEKDNEDIWANRARAFPQALKATTEMAADLVDIPLATISAQGESLKKSYNEGDLFSKKAILDSIKAGGSAWYQEATPWGESTDTWRDKNLYDRFDSITKNTDLNDPVRTGLEFGTEALLTGGRNVVKNVLSSVGQGVGAGLGDYLDGEGNYGSIVGAILTGVINPFEYLAKRSAQWAGIDSPELTAADKLATDIIGQGEAKENILKNAESGNQGSVATLAETQEIANLEASLVPGSFEATKVAEQVRSSVIQDLEDLDASFGSGSSQQAFDDAGEATEKLYNDLGEEILSNKNNAQAIQQNLSDSELAEFYRTRDQLQASSAAQAEGIGNNNVSEASSNLAETITDFKSKLENTARDLWNKYNEGAESISPEAIKIALKKERKLLNGTQKDLLNQHHGNAIRAANKLGRRKKPVNADELSDVIKIMKESYEKSKNSNRGIPQAQDLLLKTLQKRLESVFENTVTPEKFQDYLNAKAATKDKYRRIEPKADGQTKTSNIGNARRNRSDIEYYDALIANKGKGAAIAQELKVMNDPAVLKSFEEMLFSNPEVINQKFLNDKSEFFKIFPKMKSRAEALVNKNTALTKTLDQINVLNKKIDNSSKTSERQLEKTLNQIDLDSTNKIKAIEGLPLSRYRNNPTKTLNDALNSPESGADTLKQIASSVDNAGFNRSLGDVIKKRLQVDIGNGELGLKDSSQSGWREIEPMLEKVLGKDSKEFQAAKKAVAKAKADFYRNNAVKIVADAPDSKKKALFVNILSATIASSLPGTHALMYGGKIRNMINSIPLIKNSGTLIKAQQKLEKLLTNPDEVVSLLKQADKAESNIIKSMTADQKANHLRSVFMIELNDYLEDDNATR